MQLAAAAAAASVVVVVCLVTFICAQFPVRFLSFSQLSILFLFISFLSRIEEREKERERKSYLCRMNNMKNFKYADDTTMLM